MSQLRDQILKAIIHSKRVWISPFAICEAIQCPPDVVQDCLTDLDDDGFISSWDNKDEGVVVTLTPYGAQKLGAHIVEWATSEARWAKVGDPLPPTPKTHGVLTTETGAKLDYLIDDTPGPDIQAMMSEDIGVVSALPEEKRAALPKHNWQGIQRFDEYSLPYPTVLLGGGTALWDNVKHDVCPGCKGKKLEAYEYCLRCDCWGMDEFLSKRHPNRLRVRAYTQAKAGTKLQYARIQRKRMRDKKETVLRQANEH